jgi:hypothetical protein
VSGQLAKRADVERPSSAHHEMALHCRKIQARLRPRT